MVVVRAGVVFESFKEVKKELPILPQSSLNRQKYADKSEADVNEQVKFPTNLHLHPPPHGTRSPTTKKRVKELDSLASHLEELVRAAKEQGKSLQKIPAWIQSWQSPWKRKLKGRELVSLGEDESYHLGIRVRERFPLLFNEPCHPDVYHISYPGSSCFCQFCRIWYGFSEWERKSWARATWGFCCHQ